MSRVLISSRTKSLLDTLSSFPSTPSASSSIQHLSVCLAHLGKNSDVAALARAVTGSADPEATGAALLEALRQAREVALCFPTLSVALLEGGTDGKVALTRRQCHCLIGLALLDALEPPAGRELGHLSFLGIIARVESPVAVARLACLMSYLRMYSSLPEHRREEPVVFARRAGSAATAEPATRLSELEVSLSVETRIEDVEGADSHVDFANKFLHIFRVIPSATQEEVLFSIRSELFPALMITSPLADHEAVVVTNTLRHCTYTGYQSTFAFGEDLPEPTAGVAVIAIDAVIHDRGDTRGDSMCNQYSRPAVARDLDKAAVGFAGFHHISTGNWGCGVFNGDPVLKFDQQVIAAALQGVKRLSYCVFGNEALKERLAGELEGLRRMEANLGTVQAVKQALLDSADGSHERKKWLTVISRK